MKSDRIKQIERASWVAILGNGILAVLKIVIGFISGSLAVIGDGIDSCSDVVTSSVTLFTTKIISKPPDEEHPYGHNRAETIATKVLSFVMLFVGAQLLVSTLKRMYVGEDVTIPAVSAVYVTILSIIGKLFLAYWQSRVGKKTQSSMLIANAKNMRNDIVVSSGVLIGLIFIYFLKLPIIDSIIAILVSLWIIKGAFEIFMETSTELMDGIQDREIYRKITEAVFAVKGAANPHRIRARKLANLYVIDLDIEVDPQITVKEAHGISFRVEEEIKQNVDDVYDIIVHIEPTGNIEEEKYGISSEDLSDN